jgi:hypothetical protein
MLLKKKLAKVTGPNQFSLAVGHRTTTEVDEVTAWAGFTVLTYLLQNVYPTNNLS